MLRRAVKAFGYVKNIPPKKRRSNWAQLRFWKRPSRDLTISNYERYVLKYQLFYNRHGFFYQFHTQIIEENHIFYSDWRFPRNSANLGRTILQLTRCSVKSSSFFFLKCPISYLTLAITSLSPASLKSWPAALTPVADVTQLGHLLSSHSSSTIYLAFHFSSEKVIFFVTHQLS